MTTKGTWEGVAIEVHEGTLEGWEFNDDSLPWIFPSEKGLQVCVTDRSLTVSGIWDYVVVALRLDDLLPRMLRTFVVEPEDVQPAIATAESLERMAAAIRAKAADLTGTTARKAA